MKEYIYGALAFSVVFAPFIHRALSDLGLI